MAHGGEGIAVLDGRVIFVHGAYPGDTITAEITEVKKNFARAVLVEVLSPSPLRSEQVCPAAARGAGCCDFGDLNPAEELGLKYGILKDQLSRLAKVGGIPEAELINLPPERGWRTRVRLGVDTQGRAGFRALKSNDLITEVACTQAAPGLLDGIMGEGARTFTPGAEIIVAIDSEGVRHIVETRRAARGRRSEKVTAVLEGTGEVTQNADDHEFRFPAEAFWQAHRSAPGAYTALVRNWLAEETLSETAQPVAWDLYGGVGLFVPALADSLGEGAQIHSVEMSKAATRAGQATLDGYDVVFHNARVEQHAVKLPKPQVVLLDPPRSGAGAKVVESLATAAPELVVHVGCDPATFARDIAAWAEHGYQVTRMTVFNAFPGTHHFEVLALLRPAPESKS
ncbi:putative RNA methyltransferase [Corynebacterium occultum]|uniref:Putative RNA methyltransferase n=2 Tax=Corynebacterium occultum TaxID=2675219 RepID=A0A6B8VTR9_9CORY|nr:putative RNA methyltransferase [Corynebacterium occultum]